MSSILTVRELKDELRDLPGDMEVHLEVRGWEVCAKGVYRDWGGASAWVTIGDFPDKPKSE